MKIQFKWKYPWGDGSMFGDIINITEERIIGRPRGKEKWIPVYHIKTLNGWVTLHGSQDVMKIWPHLGEYMTPSEWIYLMKNRAWKLVPKSKISMKKQ
jgi:hypothetical protein